LQFTSYLTDRTPLGHHKHVRAQHVCREPASPDRMRFAPSSAYAVPHTEDGAVARSPDS